MPVIGNKHIRSRVRVRPCGYKYNSIDGLSSDLSGASRHSTAITLELFAGLCSLNSPARGRVVPLGLQKCTLRIAVGSCGDVFLLVFRPLLLSDLCKMDALLTHHGTRYLFDNKGPNLQQHKT